MNSLSTLSVPTTTPASDSTLVKEKDELSCTVDRLQSVNLGLRKQNERLAALLDPESCCTPPVINALAFPTKRTHKVVYGPDLSDSLPESDNDSVASEPIGDALAPPSVGKPKPRTELPQSPRAGRASWKSYRMFDNANEHSNDRFAFANNASESRQNKQHHFEVFVSEVTKDVGFRREQLVFRHKILLSWTTLIFIASTLLHLFTKQLVALPIPDQPLLCQTEQGRTLWKVPDRIECPKLLISQKDKPMKTALTVYKPSSVQHEVTAVICRKIERTVTFYTNFIGDKFATSDTRSRTVLQKDCKEMFLKHTCNGAPLTKNGSIWQTNNVLEFAFPWPVMGSFSTRNKTVTNCYMFDTFVASRFGDKYIHGPLESMSQCHFSSGFCILRDGSAALWLPQNETQCQFLPMKTLNGTRLGNAWVAESREFALTFGNFTQKVTDCGGQTLYVSDQGYAVPAETLKDHRRGKRDTAFVTNDALAAELMALEIDILDSFRFSFEHTLASLCATINSVAAQLSLLLPKSATLAARFLLNHSDIHARMSLHNIIEVWPCTKVAQTQISFRGTNDFKQCFEFIPVNIRISDEYKAPSYLDPHTMILHDRSPEASCSISREIPLWWDNDLWLVDQVEGKAKPLAQSRLSTLVAYPPKPTDVPNFPLTVFHNLVLENLTTVHADSRLEHAIRLLRQMGHIGTLEPGAPYKMVASHFKGSLPKFSVSIGSLIPNLLPKINVWRAWITVCALYVTLSLLWTVVQPHLDRYIWILAAAQNAGNQSREWINRIRRPIFDEWPSFARPSPDNLGSLRPPVPEVSVPLQTINEETEPEAIPPEVMNVQHQMYPYCAQAIGKINHVCFSFLMDTGSAISVAPIRVAETLGIEIIEEPSHALAFLATRFFLSDQRKS